MDIGKVEIRNPIEVAIIETPKNDFLYYESKELSFTGKTLLSLGIVGIIYGNYDLKVNNFLGISIIDTNNNFPGIIGIVIIMECLIFILIFLRDFFKDMTDKNKIITSNIEKIAEYQNAIKDLKTGDEGRKDSLNNVLIRLKNENNEIILQIYQKNIIYYGLKILYPLSIGIIGAISIGKNKIQEVITMFPIEYLTIPIFLIMILFVLNKYKNKALKRQKL